MTILTVFQIQRKLRPPTPPGDEPEEEEEGGNKEGTPNTSRPFRCVLINQEKLWIFKKCEMPALGQF